MPRPAAPTRRLPGLRRPVWLPNQGYGGYGYPNQGYGYGNQGYAYGAQGDAQFDCTIDRYGRITDIDAKRNRNVGYNQRLSPLLSDNVGPAARRRVSGPIHLRFNRGRACCRSTFLRILRRSPVLTPRIRAALVVLAASAGLGACTTMGPYGGIAVGVGSQYGYGGYGGYGYEPY